VGVIKCPTDNGRTKIRVLLKRIGLGPHFRPTERPEIRGIPMTFRKPSPSPTDIRELLQLLFAINGLSGEGGGFSERVDTPAYGVGQTMVTVHFPEELVRYAEQRNWRLKEINGSISMQGNKVRARQCRSVEQDARAEDADRSEKRRRLAQQQPNGAPGSANPAQPDQGARGGVASSDAGPREPLGDWAADTNNPTPSTSRAAAKAAAAADAATAAAAKADATAHLPPKLDMNNTYPTALVAILDMLPERGQPGAPPSFVSRPNRHSPTTFALLTKAQKSRLHRKLKKLRLSSAASQFRKDSDLHWMQLRQR
jgi:hypothetical protein